MIGLEEQIKGIGAKKNIFSNLNSHNLGRIVPEQRQKNIFLKKDEKDFLEDKITSAFQIRSDFSNKINALTLFSQLRNIESDKINENYSLILKQIEKVEKLYEIGNLKINFEEKMPNSSTKLKKSIKDYIGEFEDLGKEEIRKFLNCYQGQKKILRRSEDRDFNKNYCMFELFKEIFAKTKQYTQNIFDEIESLGFKENNQFLGIKKEINNVYENLEKSNPIKINSQTLQYLN